MSVGRALAATRFGIDISRSLSRRGRALIEAGRLAEDVPALEPLEAYFVVKELGVADAVPILHHATPEQLQAIVDLDCWQGDHLSLADLDTWLGPFAAEGAETLCRAFFSLEGELQILFLARGLTIHDGRSEEIPDEGKNTRRMTTVDSYFVLDAHDDGEREIDPFFLVNALYRHDAHEAFRLLTAAKWELGGEMEEECHRFRQGRLEDLGFPSREEAFKIFLPPPAVPPSPPLSAPAPLEATLPALYAQCLAGPSLLVNALAYVAEPERLSRLEQDLVYLINAVVVAGGDGPHDIAHVRQMATYVRDTVSLGVEILLKQSVPFDDVNSEQVGQQAAQLFQRWSVRDLFRHGHAPGARLAAAARAFFDDPVAKAWLERSGDSQTTSKDSLDRAFVLALLRRPPVYGGYDAVDAGATRSFSCSRDLDAAEHRLDEITQRVV